MLEWKNLSWETTKGDGTILGRYDIKEESYRQLFQVAKLEAGGTKS